MFFNFTFCHFIRAHTQEPRAFIFVIIYLLSAYYVPGSGLESLVHLCEQKFLPVSTRELLVFIIRRRSLEYIYSSNFVNSILMTEGRGTKLGISDFRKGVFDNKNATIAYIIFRPFLWKFGPHTNIRHIAL